ncbi:MAG: hypothetical protein R2729_02910 [Bryobacteraceae bacterium]
MRRAILTAALAAVSLSATPLHPLQDLQPADAFGFDGPGYSIIGWKFVPSEDLFVTAMGAYAPLPVGEPFWVLLWNYTMHTLVTYEGFQADGSGTWQWQTLGSPRYLISSNEYIVAMYRGAVPPFPEPWPPNVAPTPFTMTILDRLQYGVGDLDYILAADAVDVVPELRTWWMAMIAGLGMVGLKLRRPVQG